MRLLQTTFLLCVSVGLLPIDVGWLGTAVAGPAAAPPKRPVRAVQPLTCVTLYRARRYRAARRCFRALLSKTGSDAQILYAIGYSSYQLGEHRVALGVFRRVLALQPSDGDALFMSGLASAQLRRHRRALSFFRRALKAGLKSESPDEARRHIRLLRRVLASRLASGWLWSLGLTMGYDSHPRLGGSAAYAGTSDGSASEGSGFAALTLGLGYRWLRVLRRRRDGLLRGALSWAYRFGQSIVFTDLSRTAGGPGSWRTHDVTGGVSLQTHGVGLVGRLLGQRWDVGLRVGARAELSGLRDFTPLLTGGDLEGDLSVRWHRLTRSHLTVAYYPQRALSSTVGYLTGHGLVTEVRQSLRFRRLRMSVGYGLGVWWLGNVVTPVSECTAGEACGLNVPFANHAHRGEVRLGLRAVSWLNFEARVTVTHRTYWGEGEYRLTTGGLTEHQRIDLIQQYRLQACFRLFKGLHLTLAYSFARNHSTIDEQSVGIEEGYDRHRVWAGVRYVRW